jgi:hypothetical protein
VSLSRFLFAIRSSGYFEQHINDWAFRYIAAIAPRSHIPQYPFELAKISDFPVNDIGMVERQTPDLGAGVRATIHQPQQFPHFLERETQFPAAANEKQSFDVILAIHPVVPLGSGGSG